MDVIINAKKDLSFAALTHKTHRISDYPLNSQHDFYLNGLIGLGQDPVYTPLADLLRRQHQLDDGDWMLISPMHWEVTHNDAMIVGFADDLGLNDRLARIWFAEMSQFLSQDGFTLVYHDTHHWLMKAPPSNKIPQLKSPNLCQMNHQSLMPVLEALDPTLYWQRLFTELQMFLSTHPLNASKQQHLSINGMWCWGSGLVNIETTRPVMTDDPLFQLLLSETITINFDVKQWDPDTLILLGYWQDEYQVSLAQSTRKQTVNWFWNDVAYQTVKQPWYRQFSLAIRSLQRMPKEV